MNEQQAAFAVNRLTRLGYVAAACYYNNVVHVSDPIHGYTDGHTYGVIGHATVLLETEQAVQRFINVRH